MQSLLDFWNFDLIERVENREIEEVTKNRYLEWITTFKDWMSARPELKLVDLKPIHVKQFRKFLTKTYESETANNYIVAGKSLFNFLSEYQPEFENKQNPFSNKRILVSAKNKAEKADKKAIQYKEALKSILWLDKNERYKGQKIPSQKAAALSLAAGGGLRISEILKVRRKDIIISREKGKGITSIQILVQPSKGRGRRRTLMINRTLIAVFKKWFDFQPKIKNIGDITIPKVWRTAFDPELVFTYAKVTLFKTCQVEIFKEFNLSCTPHSFRYAFAFYYLQKGGALDDLQNLMGHGSKEMTLHYTRASQGTLPQRIKDILNQEAVA